LSVFLKPYGLLVTFLQFFALFLTQNVIIKLLKNIVQLKCAWFTEETCGYSVKYLNSFWVNFIPYIEPV